MAILHLVRTDTGQYCLQGTGDPSRTADVSLDDWDGAGGDPFHFGNQQWTIVKGIPGVEYDPEDHDSWWDAQQQSVVAAEAAGIDVPPYAKD